MVFSDGGTENPAKILNVYTNESRSMTTNARIFTYAVGKCLTQKTVNSKNIRGKKKFLIKSHNV